MLVLASVRDHVLVYFAPMQRDSKHSGIKTITKHESAYKAFPHSPLASEWLIYKPAVNTEQLLTSFYRKAKKYLKKNTCSAEYYEKLFFFQHCNQQCVFTGDLSRRDACLAFRWAPKELGPTKQITRDNPKTSLPAKQWPTHPYSWRPASPLTSCNLCQHKAGSHRLHAP